MDFLYRNIHMEQKKWDASSQMTIEEDINIPELKRDCTVLLLKDAVSVIEETRVGREQVVVKGYLQYQVLYESGEDGRLEQLTGKLPFEENIHVDSTAPGELATAKAVIEDFKVSMINTRKIAVQSIVMLYVHMYRLSEEDWTFDVANAGTELEKLFEEKEVMQLCQKKSDVFRVKEDLEIPGGYPEIQNLLWHRVTLGDMEVRPMEGKISIKGEMNGFFIYVAQGTGQSIKMFHKKIPFHGVIDCSVCESGMVVSVIPTLNSYSAEVKEDLDGEERIIYVEAALDLQIRVYGQEKVALLKDMYSTTGEVVAQQKTVRAPIVHIAGEGKCKLKHLHKLREGIPKMVHVLHTCGSILPDREAWEDGKLHLMGTIHAQILYQSNEIEMPYAVCECDIPYMIEMESNEDIYRQEGREKPSVLWEARLEQLETQMIDSEEMEIKGILAISVLAMADESCECIGGAEIMPLDTVKFAALPGMVMCFTDKETPLWEYGKKYYMSVEEIKRINDLNENILKPGNGILLVKGMTG